MGPIARGVPRDRSRGRAIAKSVTRYESGRSNIRKPVLRVANTLRRIANDREPSPAARVYAGDGLFVVALAELSGDLEEEAAPIASALGLSRYDVKARLGGVLPRVAFQSSSHADASRVLAALRARGHGVLLCDTNDVVPSARLVRLHRFSFDETSLRANDSGPQLAFEDIAAILATNSRTDVARTTHETELVVIGTHAPTTVQVERTRHEHLAEHTVHIFPRARPEEPMSPPWLLHERDAQYLALGPAMRATRYENFVTTVSLLRTRAPGAIYDDRFSAAPLGNEQRVHVRGHDGATPWITDAGNDLAVHLLAMWLLGGRGGPYR